MMNTTNQTASLRVEGNTFYLEGILDFDSVVPLLPLLKNAIKTAQAIELDLSGVTYTNSAGVALMLDIQRQAMARKTGVSFMNIPADMQRIITMCGLQDVLVNPARQAA